LTTGALTISTALPQLQAQLAAANNISGKGTSAIKTQTVESVQNAIDALQAQQKQIIDTFGQQLSILQTNIGNQSAVSSIEQIAAALQKAADAGASAADQLAFFNDSVAALTTTLGNQLASTEQNTLGMLRQDISLRQQQSDLINNTNLQIQQITQSLGVSRVLTPAQSAAQQIAQIKYNEQEQLANMTEQQNTLEAQLNGQAELFGWSVKDLSNTNAKTLLIQKQLDLQTAITAQTVAQIAAEKQYYGSLLSGVIPTLPAGGLPTPFSGIPAGSNYTFGNINIVYSGNADPNALANALKAAIPILNQQTYNGTTT